MNYKSILKGIKYKKKAFTLAEVLITLIVIGVVAAITVPVLMNNYRKEQYVTGFKKSYSSLQNGFKTYIAVEGVSSVVDTTLWRAIAKVYAGNMDLKTVNNELSKIFSIADQRLIFFEEDVDKVLVKYKWLSPDPAEQIFGGLTLVLADGSIVYFMPYIQNEVLPTILEQMKARKLKHTTNYAEIYVDVNGVNKPNIVGRDLFGFILSEDGTLLPRGSKSFCYFVSYPFQRCDEGTPTWLLKDSSDNSCYTDEWSDGRGCAARIIDEGWKMNY